MIRRERLPSGREIPVVGQGTWRMGEDARQREREVASLRTGIDLGMTLIDTAEMYGSGGAERIVAEAIHGRRDEVFLVSKVLPENASRAGTVRAAERSLERLRTDHLDLYLLHWPGAHPIADTLEAFDRLRSQGKVVDYGVSNFDVAGMKEAAAIPAGAAVAANQVLYNLQRRGIERDLIPWCAARGIVVMAYSPLEQARLRAAEALVAVAREHQVSKECVAIAWTIRRPGVVTIPKSSDPDRLRANARAASIQFSTEDLARLDAAFPAPSGAMPLETL